MNGAAGPKMKVTGFPSTRTEAIVRSRTSNRTDSAPSAASTVHVAFASMVRVSKCTWAFQERWVTTASFGRPNE